MLSTFAESLDGKRDTRERGGRREGNTSEREEGGAVSVPCLHSGEGGAQPGIVILALMRSPYVHCAVEMLTLLENQIATEQGNPEACTNL